MLYELMLEPGYTLTDKVKKKNSNYLIANGETIIVFCKISKKTVEEIIKTEPKNCIALDRLFLGNDKLKTNTALQMKNANAEFRIV